MRAQAQLSTYISKSTRDEFDRYTEANGLKKGYVVEQALLYHLKALREIPPEYIVPAEIVVDRESFEAIMESFERPPKPTPALRKLMKGRRKST